MTDPAASKSVWEDLPEYEKIQKWQKAVPNAAARILTQLEKDAEFVRKDAERRLRYALIIVVLTLTATVILALAGKAIPSIFTSSGGTIAVATTLITGRSSALSRRKRQNRNKKALDQ